MQLASRNQKLHRRHLRIAIAIPFASLALSSIAGLFPPAHRPLHAAPQEEYEQHDEVVANLAAGRVIIAVFKDAILIASIENHIESDALPPAIIPISGRRAAILMGAISWNSPSPPVEWARLDRELPNLHANMATAVAPHLGGTAVGAEAKDIEDIGEGLRIRLSAMMKKVHGQLDVPEGQPLIELVLADYQVDYGPEVWTLQYGIKQQIQRGDFWDTKIQRPRYSQLWPPEKTDPHTVIELHYPPEEKTPTLLDLLRQKDPRLAAISSSDAAMSAVADAILHGDTSKLLAAAAVPYFRAAFNTLVPAGASLSIAQIDHEQGFEWLLAPPPPPAPPKNAQQQQPTQQDRPADAPSLLRPPPK